MTAVSFSSKAVFKQEARRNSRIRECWPISWKIQDQDVRGTAKVRNISASGMLLEASAGAPLPENSVLALQAVTPTEAGLVPSAGRMVWSKRKGFSNALLMGIEFVEPAQEVINRLQEEIQSKIIKIESAGKIRNTVGAILFGVMAVLVAIFLSQQAVIYRNIDNTNRLMANAAGRQGELYAGLLDRYNVQRAELAQATQELDQAKILLAQTQSMLAETNQKFDAMKVEYDALSKQLAVLQEKMRLLDGDLANIGEGKIAIAMHKKGLRAVKVAIHNLKVAAQDERDKVALETGNLGYLVKDGKSSQVAASSEAVQEKKVKIQVRMAE